MPAALWACNDVPLLPDSSLSQWVHACDALDLPMLQREELDAFIDQLYKDIEKGEAWKRPWAASRSAVSQNPSMAGVGRDLCGSSSPTPLLK